MLDSIKDVAFNFTKYVVDVTFKNENLEKISSEWQLIVHQTATLKDVKEAILGRLALTQVILNSMTMNIIT